MTVEYPPTSVIVTNASEIGKRPKKRQYATFLTVVLTATDPVKQALGRSEFRVKAFIHSIDQNICIGQNQGQVNAYTAGNSGEAIVVAKTTNPVAYEVDTQEELFVAASSATPSYPISVAIQQVFEVEC